MVWTDVLPGVGVQDGRKAQPLVPSFGLSCFEQQRMCGGVSCRDRGRARFILRRVCACVSECECK